MRVALIFFWIILKLPFVIGDFFLSDSLVYHEDRTLVSECVVKVFKGYKFTKKKYMEVVLIDVDDYVIGALSQLERLVYYSSGSLCVLCKTVEIEAYIIKTDDLSDLEDKLVSLKRDYYWNPKAVFVLMIEQEEIELQQVSKLLLRDNIFNITLIVGRKENYKIYAYGPKLDPCRRPLSFVFINDCSGFKDEKYVLHLPRTMRLDGCELTLISHDYWPYINLNESTYSGFAGVEQYLLQLLTNVSGIKFHLVKYKRNEDFGHYEGNMTFSGMLHEIQTYQVEGAIGGYYMTWTRNLAFDSVYPFLVDNLLLFMRRSEYLKTWEAVYKQLQLISCLLFFGFFVIFSIAVVSLSIFHKNGERDVVGDVLIIIGYFANNGGAKYLRPGYSQTLMIVNLFVFALYFSWLIQACLLSARTHPIRNYQITELEEVYEFCKPLITDDFKDIFDGKTLGGICDTAHECAIQVEQRKDEYLFTLISDITFSYMFQNTTVDSYPNLYKLKEPVESLYQTIYFRRGTAALKTLDKHMRNIERYGLVEHYLEELEYAGRIKYAAHFQDIGFLTMSWDDLKEAYYILMGGLGISFASFILEVMVVYLKKVRGRYVVGI